MIQVQDLEPLTKSTTARGTHILDLNFYCLYEIFSLPCFKILDLCSIGEAHNRLKEVVDDVFSKRFNDYSVRLLRTSELEKTIRILSNFGPFISKLGIFPSYGKLTQLALLDSVIKYCSNTLEYLRLSGSEYSEDQTIKLQQIVCKLKKLSLHQCTIYSGKMLFSNCESLVELKLVSVWFKDQNTALLNTFPKLNRFVYWNSNQSNDFFSRHPNLKSLRLKGFRGISDLLPGIADNCNQLADLDIKFEQNENNVKFENALTSILTLDHLNKLVMMCDGRNLTQFIPKLKELKSLQFLSLWWVSGDSELVPAVSKLSGLQGLKLWYCRGLENVNQLADLERLTELTIASSEYLDFDLVSMIKRLINLKTLYLHVWGWSQKFTMNKKMYLRIVDVVRDRPGRFQGALQISCYVKNNGSANSALDGDYRGIVKIIEFEDHYNDINTDDDDDEED